MPDGGGYRYDSVALNSIVEKLRAGARHLETANRKPVESVDAGASSQIVGDALANLLESSITTAHLLDTAADKVRIADGAYADVENTNEGEVRKQMHDSMGRDWGEPMSERNIPLN